MFLLRRWKAVLAWSAISQIFGVGIYWLGNLNPPYFPEWTIFLVFVIVACFGAAYITETW